MQDPGQRRVFRLGQIEARRVRIVADVDMEPDADATWRLLSNGKTTSAQSMPFENGELTCGELGKEVSPERMELVDPGRPPLEWTTKQSADWSSDRMAVVVMVEAVRKSFDDGSVVEIHVPAGTDIEVEGVASALEVVGAPGAVDIRHSGQVVLDLEGDEAGRVDISNTHCVFGRFNGSRELKIEGVAEAHLGSEPPTASSDLHSDDLDELDELPTWAISDVGFLQVVACLNPVEVSGSSTMVTLVSLGASAPIKANLQSLLIRFDTLGGRIDLEGSAEMLISETSTRADIKGVYGDAYIKASKSVCLDGASFMGNVAVHSHLRDRPLTLNAEPGWSPTVSTTTDLGSPPGMFRLKGDWQDVAKKVHSWPDIRFPVINHQAQIIESIRAAQEQLVEFSALGELRRNREMKSKAHEEMPLPLRDPDVRTKRRETGKSQRYGFSVEPSPPSRQPQSPTDLPPAGENGFDIG
jgi:hypothetical protein